MSQDELFYLWHLAAVGLIDLDANGRGTPNANWVHPGCCHPPAVKDREIKVAIIDNGCARWHPNLTPERIVNRIAFTSDRRPTVFSSLRPDDLMEGELAAI
ncbi:MAG: hypothetical protein AAFQ22_15115, partial [Pseudomonadota bacterium]